MDVGPSKYCILDDNLPKNTYNLVEQNVYTLEDLFVKYSTSLELRIKEAQEELWFWVILCFELMYSKIIEQLLIGSL